MGIGPDSTRRIETKNFADALRKNPTEAEKKLWAVLANKQLGGKKFRRQHRIGPYIVDFVCAHANLIIELDGGQHQQHVAYDEVRSDYLKKQHFRVLRFWNHDVLENLEGVVQVIQATLGHPCESASADSTPRQRGVILEDVV